MTESVTPEWRHFRKENSGIAGNNILSLCIDDSDRVLVGHDADGLSRFDGSTWKTLFPHSFVSHVTNAGSGHIWILKDQSLYRLDDGNLTPGNSLGFVVPNGYPWQRNYLTSEKSGTVYFSYYEYGSKIARNKNGVTTVYDFNNYGSASVLFAKKDTFWVELSGGLWRFDPNYPNGISIPGVRVECAFQDADNQLWAGGSGLYRADGQSWTVFSRTEVPPYPILAITGDEKYVWAGGTGGFARWNGSSWTPFPHDSTLVNQDIRALAVDKKGNLWIGTYGGGLYEYREGGIEEK